MSASNDDSESVDQFLARIASLSHKKDDEEAVRARKMEDDMMQARRERQARRAGISVLYKSCWTIADDK
jgi:hypothetical protein